MFSCLVLDNIHHLAMVKPWLVHLPPDKIPLHPQCCRRLSVQSDDISGGKKFLVGSLFMMVTLRVSSDSEVLDRAGLDTCVLTPNACVLGPVTPSEVRVIA